ncbi:hypothetical protein HDV00_011473 [Rhizophlyctis rosea]|nr:hypothetical protein HDV00_011473 [Rhizophlyctis rosea]
MHSIKLAAFVLALAGAAQAETINQVQGANHFSSLDGQAVHNVTGRVTKINSDGFFIQDPHPDSDPNTSDGVFVFSSSGTWATFWKNNVAFGQEVQVSGKVQEYGYIPPTGPRAELPLTEISSVNYISITNSTLDPIIPQTITKLPMRQMGPVPAVMKRPIAKQWEFDDWKTYSEFDRDVKGMDFWESLEGMLVRIEKPISTGRDYTSSGRPVFWVVSNATNPLPNLGKYGTLNLEGDGETYDDFGPEKVFILGTSGTSGNSAKVKPGDELETIDGVVTYWRGYYGIEPVTKLAVKTASNNVVPPAKVQGESELAVGSYNVENLDALDPPTRFTQLANHIVNYMSSPDIIALTEFQDDNGPAQGSTDSTQTISLLISAIESANGPKYSALWVNPNNNTDGGEPGGNIRPVIFYNPTRVTPAAAPTPTGGADDSQEIIGTDSLGPLLKYQVGRINPTSTAWNISRKSIVAGFEFKGERVFVIANHFSSKSGGTTIHGARQPPVSSAEEARDAQAKEVRNFVIDLVEADSKAKVIIAGDLNDFTLSHPIKVLLGTSADAPSPNQPLLYELEDELLPLSRRFSYIFDGLAQSLDHIITTKNLLDKAEVEPLNINTVVPAADSVSDHDAVVARFAFPIVPPVTTTTTTTATTTTTTTMTTTTTPERTTTTTTTPADTTTTTNPADTTTTTPPATCTPSDTTVTTCPSTKPLTITYTKPATTTTKWSTTTQYAKTTKWATTTKWKEITKTSTKITTKTSTKTATKISTKLSYKTVYKC